MAFKPGFRIIGFLLASVALCFAALESAHAGPNASLLCLSDVAENPRLPYLTEVGIETIHRDPQRIITVFVPLPLPGTAGRILDMNRTPGGSRPSRFILGDGTLHRRFVGVDLSPASRLSACVEELAQLAQTSGSPLEFLAYRLMDFLSAVPEEDVISWDQGLAPPSRVSKLFQSAKDWPVGQYPVATGLRHPVIPLESYLKLGRSYCLQKALLASLVLDRLGMAHRLVFGGTETSGHTWIELAGGRLLDPTWQILAYPDRRGTAPGWLKHGQSLLFEDQVYPFLALGR